MLSADKNERGLALSGYDIYRILKLNALLRLKDRNGGQASKMEMVLKSAKSK